MFASALFIIALKIVEVSTFPEHIRHEFYLKTNPPYGPERLSEIWPAPTLISCIANCMLRFPDECLSVIYNHQTQICIPGQWLDPAEPQPLPEEGDLYVSNQCESTKGFSIHAYGDTRSCLFQQIIYMNYTDARDSCESLDSYLYIIDNMDKFFILQNIFEEAMWIGLNDMEKEGIYIWSDGKEFDPTFKDLMFLKGEPNNYGEGENCVGMLLPLPTHLNDDSCYKTYRFVCEKPL